MGVIARWGAAVVVMALALALAVRLSGPTAETERQLAWDVPCVDAVDAAATLQDLLLDGARAADQVSVTVRERAPGQWVGDVEIAAPEFHLARRIQGPRCRDVADGLLLVIAGALDPWAVASAAASPAALDANATSEPPAPTVPEVVPSPAPPTPPPTPPKPAPTSAALAPAPPTIDAVARPIVAEIFAEGGGTAGLLPGVAAWGGGGVGVRVSRLRLEVAGQYTSSRTVPHPEQAAVAADITLASVGAAGCWVFAARAAAIDVPVCAGVELGAMTARGRGLDRSGTTRGLWLAGVPQARLRWRATPWLALGVTVAVPVALRRVAFSVDDLASPVATSRVLGVRLGPSLTFTLPNETGPTRRRGRQRGA